jgi:hypothetical protein
MDSMKVNVLKNLSGALSGKAPSSRHTSPAPGEEPTI